MDNITTIALSRLAAQSRALEVTANNLANANTPGFRAERTLFSTWLAHEPSRAMPPGGSTIAYTQDRATYREREPGSRQHTGNALDVAIGDPAGWLTVQTPRGPRLTRSGHFELAPDGSVVDAQGNKLLDTSGNALQTATTDTTLAISGDGTLLGANGPRGRIGVVQLQDENKLAAEGGHLFAAGAPTQPLANPQIVQGAIEQSNVAPIVETTRMMQGLRDFQFATQMIQSEGERQTSAIDKIMSKGSNA
jgi:flagellar basal-body rod protein FlgF